MTKFDKVSFFWMKIEKKTTSILLTYRLLTMIRIPAIDLEIFNPLLLHQWWSLRRAAHFERFRSGKSSCCDSYGGDVHGDDTGPNHRMTNGGGKTEHHRRGVTVVVFQLRQGTNQTKVVITPKKGGGVVRFCAEKWLFRLSQRKTAGMDQSVTWPIIWLFPESLHSVEPTRQMPPSKTPHLYSYFHYYFFGGGEYDQVHWGCWLLVILYEWGAGRTLVSSRQKNIYLQELN